MVERVCRNCEQPFTVLARQARRRNRAIFCGRACHSSDIAKRKNANQLGELNPNWKGGVAKDHMRYALRFRAKSPEKVRAQVAFAHAVRSGRIVRPTECSQCHITCKAHGHHDDYSKPLSVRWLCRLCHNRHHAALRARKAA